MRKNHKCIGGPWHNILSCWGGNRGNSRVEMGSSNSVQLSSHISTRTGVNIREP
jgi:hypothetical protein